MTIIEQLTRSGDDLWFRRRPALAVAVAVGLFAGVFVLCAGSSAPTEAYSMFYVLPVALLAVAFGIRGGAVGGGVSVALTVVWAVTGDVHLGALAWVAGVVPILALGLLLGYAADRARRAEARQRDAEAAALLHRQAIEINDSLVQGLATARWALDRGRVEDGLALLDETMADAQDLVSGLIRRAEMGDRTHAIDRAGARR